MNEKVLELKNDRDGFYRSHKQWPMVCLACLMFLWSMETALYGQRLVISEFNAANQSGLSDENSEWSDWIEIFNPETYSVSLNGWYLTDDSKNLAQWQFPGVTLQAQGFIVVFASGKDRKDPKGKLHTNFQLSKEGEYLALVRPDGKTVVSEFAPAYPRQINDAAYGWSMADKSDLFISFAGAGRVFFPSDDKLGHSWIQQDFDDSSWTSVTMGVGYYQSSPNDPEESGPKKEDITRSNDTIVPTSNNSPGSETVINAIDNNPNTKYLNFDKLNAGLTVAPSIGITVISGLRITSANDAPDRDPTSFLLLGSDDGQKFTEIARGTIPDFTARFTSVEVSFSNNLAFSIYRLLFPTIRSPSGAVAMQIAEVEFLGQTGSNAPTLKALIQSDIHNLMYGRNSSAYVRLPFAVSQMTSMDGLTLRVQYDDGFVAYLNGVEVARANVQAQPAFNSLAITNRLRSNAVIEQRFNLQQFAGLVRSGTNVLAIHGLNDRLDSPDFLLRAQLENTQLVLGNSGYFVSPTPGQQNDIMSPGLVSDPTPSHIRGFYETPFDLSMSCATESATIRYTTNGAVPTATVGLTYTRPVRIDRSTTLRVAAFKENWISSRTITHTYMFLNDVVTQTYASTIAAGFPTTWNGQAADYGLDPRVVGPLGQDKFGGKYAKSIKSDLQSLPTISLVMNIADMFGPQGVYSNPNYRGDAWERAVSMEYLYPDNHENFQADAGIRIQGGAFRQFNLTLKKSFRLVFRDKYGKSELHYPLFGSEAVDRFKNFVLRANSNDAWPYAGGNTLYVRDSFALETARAMGRKVSHSSFVHLYINGFYWGLYNPVERPDAAFSASYYGGDRDSWDAINQDSAPDGNYDAWRRLTSLLTQDVSKNEVYQKIQGNNPDGTRNPAYENLLDVENMIDYMIVNFYIGNADWPGRNWWVGRNRDGGDGFKFYPWDSETALGMTGIDHDTTGASGAVAQPYAALKANADFRLKFADRVYKHFFNGGALFVNPSSPAWDPVHPENNRPAARFAALSDRVRQAIVGESARWGDQLTANLYSRDEHWQKTRDGLLSGYFPRRSAIVLEQFRRAGLYPRTDVPTMSQNGGVVPSGYKLKLTVPKGNIFYTTNGTDPRFTVTTIEAPQKTLLNKSTARKALIPSTANGGSSLGVKWQGGMEPFDDSQWISGTKAVGYDVDTAYVGLIGIDVKQYMYNKNGSAFIRIPFNYDGVGRERLVSMVLRMQFDDGFVAYLNGVKIASTNAPSDLFWNATASADYPDYLAVNFTDFNTDSALQALKTGQNILAIHGLNLTTINNDFLIGAELVVKERPPSTNSASSTNSSLMYSEPFPIADLTTVKARALNGQEWSVLCEATFTVGAPALILSEVHYHPADPDSQEVAAGFTDANEFEFVELTNAGEGAYGLNDVRFVSGIEFDFTGSSISSLPAGHSVLIVKNRAAFTLRYGTGFAIAGEYSGKLDNAGERIEVVNGKGEMIVDFTYGTDSPWPKSADGTGPSLEIIDPNGDPNSQSNWRASYIMGGSPGDLRSLMPLTIGQVFQEDGQLRFQIEGATDKGYTIYVSDSLPAYDWQVFLRSDPTNRIQEVNVTIDLSTQFSTRFYRISIP